MKPLNELSARELDELASEARSFVNSRVYGYLFQSLREKYIQQLVQANVGDLTATSAHASMKVLEDIQGELRSFETEIQMRKR